MSLRQQNATCRDTVHDKTMSQLLRGFLAALVLIDIEGEIDGALAIAQLVELVGVELRTQRAGHVVASRLPQCGIVESELESPEASERIPATEPLAQPSCGQKTAVTRPHLVTSGAQ